MPKPTPIDPFDQQHWNKPLFVVYGSTGFPQMLCCKVRLNCGVFWVLDPESVEYLMMQDPTE